MIRILRQVWLMLLILGAQGQNKTAPAPIAVTPPPIEDFVPIPPDKHSQIRDIQYQIDQAEIRIQKLQVEIEQLKQKQVAWNSDIATIATDYAHIKSLDVLNYDFDQVNLRLVKKKPPVQEKKP